MTEKIAVVGLGYVGLPLAVALARNYDVTGFDINLSRVRELQDGHDRTDEVSDEALVQSKVNLTSDVNQLEGRDVYIVTVPTPVDKRNKPDLTAVLKATEMLSGVISKGAIVVYESTVYPGVTEDVCGPLLEQRSGLKVGKDVFLGYSPERINPGDKVHTVDKITKIVAGQTPEISKRLETIYGSMNNGNIFVAKNIKTAEAAKVIENAQRDINIAFMNEISLIFDRLGVSTYDVLDAAKTKWNFLPFTPGLVGGHCIGVDPYYLSECAKKNGLNPEVILSGRRLNDAMGAQLAKKIHTLMSGVGAYGRRARVLVMGLTFKENVPDLRNSKVIDVIHALEDFGHQVSVTDVKADAVEAKDYYEIDLIRHSDVVAVQNSQKMAVGQNVSQSDSSVAAYDCVIGAVSHDEYKLLDKQQFAALVKPGGVVIDIKNMWSQDLLPENAHYWKL